jgi:hypothetical protein
VGLAMKAIMIGYWVILVGLVFDVVGTVWDAVDELTGEEALGGKIKVPRNRHSNPGSHLRVTDGVETPRVKTSEYRVRRKFVPPYYP